MNKDGNPTDGRTSAVILAGGSSSRMGCDKAALSFRGVTLLEHQVNKLRDLGIGDIVIAGRPSDAQGLRWAADEFPRRGPLGGIHAGLRAIENERALVLAVDTPLIPGEFLLRLIASHRGGVTLASLNGTPEPLIGVYDKALASECEAILRGPRSAIQELYGRTGCTLVEFDGDPVLLTNCNTPEEYARVCGIAPVEGR